MANYKSKASNWWLILPFFLLTFVSFFYIGSKAHNKIWTYCGFIYLALFGIMMVIPEDDAYATLRENYNIIVFFVGIIHAFWVRKEYQARMEIVDSAEYQEAEEAARLSRVKSKMMGSAPTSESKAEQLQRKMQSRQQSSGAAPHLEKTSTINTGAETIKTVDIFGQKEEETKIAQPIDINTCSASEMATLPGVSMVMAKKAERFRQENGGFTSPEQFFEVIQLKPHFVVQAQEFIICRQETPPTSEESEPGGRKLDL